MSLTRKHAMITDGQINDNTTEINFIYFPTEILYEIFDKCDTRSILNLNKTCILFKKLIKNDYDDKKIQEIQTDIFKLELNFILKINNNQYNKIKFALKFINNYIEIIQINFFKCGTNLSEVFNLNLRLNFITYDINEVTKNFNNFLNEYDLYNILMNGEKEFELLTYITNEHQQRIIQYKEKNIKFKFNHLGNKETFYKINNVINKNLISLDLIELNNLKFNNLETAYINANIGKILIGLNLDLTII